ncbi:MAG: helix-turn-helix transcriptional regulator [Actinocatenispora sp.]
MAQQDFTGARIKLWRSRRGMSQAVLAGLAGLSQPFLSQVEAGTKTVDRRSTLVALAEALRVSVADLCRPGEPVDPAHDRAVEAVPAIRVAIAELMAGERRPTTRTPEQVRADLARAQQLRADADYAALMPMCADLLYDLATIGPRELTEGAYLVGSPLRGLGFRDLAWHAANLAVQTARESDDPAWIGAAHHAYVMALPPETGATTNIATRAAIELQPHLASPDARAVYGMLHLGTALAAATARREADAYAHLDEAAREAESLGEPADGAGFNAMNFGPTNVALWRMTLTNELAEPGRTAELARDVAPGRLRSVNRTAAYWVDLGRALVAHGRGRRDREALTCFLNAERAAPQFTRASAVVKDQVLAMTRRARLRSESDDIRSLATAVGLYAHNREK